jgi:clan AA aspartic protease (TIGR02281 family)
MHKRRTDLGKCISIFQAFKGELVHQNCTEALRLLNIAANHGLAAAQFTLADLYVRGYCVSSDLGKARKWRKAYESNAVPQIPVPSEITITRVETPLRKEGGAFVVPVLINGAITLDFTVDSGAADVSVPADVFSTLARTGTIRDSDIIGEQTYVLADGSTSRSVTFTIRSLKVGDRVVENVRGSVAPSRGSLLLGQSFLERFKSWSIDNTKHVLFLEAQ